MIHRGLARAAIAAGAMLLGATIAAVPAAAEEAPPVPPLDIPHAMLDLPGKPPLFAKDFPTKGCDGIKGGAKAGTDGWVFDQPAQSAENFIYILGLADDKQKPVVLGLDNEGGVVNFDLGSILPDAKSLKAGTTDDSQVKSLAKAAESTDKALANAAGEADVPPEPGTIPLPDGVAGGLTGKGGVWLQTPAGWGLVYGELLYDKPETGGPETFHLVQVCTPAAPTPGSSASASAPAAKASGTGGGTGASLPVTGTNVAVLSGVGVLLVGVGALLFALRRRRDATKFVA